MNFYCLNIFAIVISYSSALMEEGYVTFDFDFDPEKDADTVYKNFTKSMYQGSDIMFTIDCKGNDTDFLLSVLLFSQPCHEKDVSVMGLTQQIFELSSKCQEKLVLQKDELKKLVVKKLDISDSTPPDAIPNEPIKPNTVTPTQQTKTTANNRKKKSLQEHIIVKRANQAKKVTTNRPIAAKKLPTNRPIPAKKRKQSRPTASVTRKTTKTQTTKLRIVTMSENAAKNVITNKPVTAAHNVPVGANVLPKTEFKAIYTLRLGFSGETKMKFHVKIESKHKGSYLSAINYPLLPFFGIMSLVYLAFAIGWFVVSCCNWRDLLRVQFWIGAVIALGMFENALFYTEYRNISSSGSENGLLYFAEIVSCIKRALARILVVIVSLGFGIVKPRLGETLHKVLAMGGLYFLLAAIEGCIRVHDSSKLVSKTQLYALVPLTALDVALCWWVFTALVQTTRTLRIRKNIVKLTLYRHFTNTLIFSVVASLAYMIWMIKQSRFTDCIDVSTIWMNDALWPFLFAIILLVIMVLWRPSINNQRYAFTPLDAGDSDGDDDMTLSDAFEGMKMRNKSDSHINGNVTKNRNKADDDLKWVEENIPSVPSTLLPTIDSDEEIIMTKFETSKMD
ncbi:transmembrane protein 87A-like [Hydractinia symbiolongicarpus]|uniref:transmembrane protein 87A-like n=1 Tax=Hydractinia symbiolongicarpus TaxID=13093 RepID=UPI00254C03B0|nr:transmembrane protein 87A-like [Hydractinia symbiolongicarpus]